MQENTFNEIADLALRHTGQSLKASKGYLMEARLRAISRRESFATLDDLVHCVKARPNPRFEKEIAAALTGKRTQFFGERDLLERIVSHALPQRLKASTTGRLRIWCAGVSTGQEAYSLAMLLEEAIGSPLANADIEIIGTDISNACIEKAEAATYGHYAVQKGLSIHRLLSHFTRRDTGDWTLNPALKKRVSFRRHNLIEPAGGLGLYDIIICCNVLSGMATPMQAVAAEHMSKQLLPGGMIFSAASESLNGLVEGLNPTKDVRGAYSRNKNDGAVAAA